MVSIVTVLVLIYLIANLWWTSCTPSSIRGSVMPDRDPDAAQSGVPSNYPHQDRFVAGASEAEVLAVDAVVDTGSSAGFWKARGSTCAAGRVFIVSAVMILIVVVVSLFPVCSPTRPAAVPGFAEPPEALRAHWFGTDLQGCDIYARTIYGARASVVVGVVTTLIVFVIGTAFGVLAGFLRRMARRDHLAHHRHLFALPLILAAIVIMQMFRESERLDGVTILAVFGWPQFARIARGATISIRNEEFITASKALGARAPGSLSRTWCRTLSARSSSSAPSVSVSSS